LYYSDEVIEEVRSRNDIVDVIGSYVSLRQKGNSYSCCCPFHHEKTPSFHVSRDKQMYHCFGCGVGGNVFTFIMEYENYTFPEAIKSLAERAGVSLPERDVSKEERARENYRATLKDVNRAAAAYYHYVLTQTPQGEIGRKYFANRGISEETIKSFGLGFADKSGGLYRYLKGRGFSDQSLKDAGLVEINESRGAYDIFWNRVMVPIADGGGKVIAFGGRVLGDGTPKYINTKDTPVFNKRQNLFAMNIARKSKRRGFIICEGYMDVISMHQAGFDNAVASLGTAFTMNQANLIKRYTDEVYLAYDSDSAGVSASLKNIAILRQVGISARVIDMKPYKDPDEFIRALGRDEYETRIKNAVTGVDFEVRILAERYNMNIPEEKSRFASDVAKILADLDDPVTRGGYIDMISDRYNVDKTGLKSKVSQYGNIRLREEADGNDESEVNLAKPVQTLARDDTHVPEKLLLTWLVNDTSLFKKLEDVITVDDFTDDDYRQVAGRLFEQYRETGQVVPAAVVNMFEDVEKQKLVGSILQTELPFDISHDEKEKAINEVIKKVKFAKIEYELQNCGDDMEKLSRLITERGKLSELVVHI
jgi:DNA primase